jgi:hypothetical protein
MRYAPARAFTEPQTPDAACEQCQLIATQYLRLAPLNSIPLRIHNAFSMGKGNKTGIEKCWLMTGNLISMLYAQMP